jgi:hypothetical protein
MALAFDIPTVWAFIIAFAVFVYVGIDGFDLGLGMLFPLFPKKADRDRDNEIQSPPYGMATRPGSCLAAAGCSRLFRSLTRY